MRVLDDMEDLGVRVSRVALGLTWADREQPDGREGVKSSLEITVCTIKPLGRVRNSYDVGRWKCMSANVCVCCALPDESKCGNDTLSPSMSITCGIP